MKKIPTLKTERLILRPFTLEDAPDVQRLAGAREIARTTLNIPHPYEDGMAEGWIETHQEQFEKGRVLELAVVKKEEGELVGAVALFFQEAFNTGELGYWIGRPFWNQGYATEAAGRIMEFGFEELKLNRIFGRFMENNPASGSIMKKLGMKEEGHLRQHVRRMGSYYDIKIFGILKSEFEDRKNRK